MPRMLSERGVILLRNSNQYGPLFTVNGTQMNRFTLLDSDWQACLVSLALYWPMNDRYKLTMLNSFDTQLLYWGRLWVLSDHGTINRF
jgi:hypothetical protein